MDGFKTLVAAALGSAVILSGCSGNNSELKGTSTPEPIPTPGFDYCEVRTLDNKDYYLPRSLAETGKSCVIGVIPAFSERVYFPWDAKEFYLCLFNSEDWICEVVPDHVINVTAEGPFIDLANGNLAFFAIATDGSISMDQINEILDYAEVIKDKYVDPVADPDPEA